MLSLLRFSLRHGDEGFHSGLGFPAKKVRHLRLGTVNTFRRLLSVVIRVHLEAQLNLTPRKLVVVEGTAYGMLRHYMAGEARETQAKTASVGRRC